MRLDGKVALVTGAGQGIGRAIALAFAEEGASLAVADVNPKTAEEVAHEIGEKGRSAVAIAVDVRQTEEIQIMVKTVIDRFGRIDVLVNNAGIAGKHQPFSESAENDWKSVIDVNLLGVLKCTSQVVNYMIEARKGSIINISSCAALEGDSVMAVYASTKAGLIGFAKSLARELAPHNITVNCIAPGVIQTAILDGTPEYQMETYLRDIPLNRIGTPEDVANAAVFLASDSGSYVTGQTIIVSGGRSMRP